ncbi:amidohydrolase family protein [Seleniivibrio sp.]|uniref:amidohydrolase family protein n=1 Tax=Seleniivibrio sp. TaxID=2898801 RepID=UPI0025F7C326|nr:amidohydrolase family protein [Seleniivibrio sp.]MCD8553268.1 amidohydrolase family protein [Seleniivibrio sp.]
MTKTAYYADYVYYNNKIHTNTHLLAENGTITGIAEIPADDYKIEVFSNSAIFPGLVNTHTHLPMGLFRGMADDLPLMEWLQNHIWPAEAKWLSPEFIQAASDLAAIEMIKSGTTLSNDMYFLSDHIATSLKKSGLKGIIGVGVLDFATKFGTGADDYIAKASDLYIKYKNDENVSVSLCPHAPYTVSPENYVKCVDFCGKHDLLLHTHLMEAANESADSLAKHGKTTVQIMNETGAFDIKSIFAHCVQLSEEEIALMGEKNVSVAHCIQSNMKLANGFAPVKQMMDAGINVTIGTDGAASNNDLDMIDEMRSVALVHKGVLRDATALSAETVLHMATTGGANALGIAGTGELKKGNKADFIVVSFDSPKTTPVFNPVSHLVYSASASDVTAMYVNGKCLMKNRVIQTMDEDKIKYNARLWADKIING